MDVYSFGLLCLWIVEQSADLENLIRDIKALLFTAQGEFQIDVLQRLTTDRSLCECLTQVFQRQGPLKNPEHSILFEVLQGTLPTDVETRSPDLSDVLTILEDGNPCTREHVEGAFISLHFRILDQ